MSQSQTTIEQAREVADWLEQSGDPARAEKIRALARSNSNLWATAKILYQDNMALRRGERIKSSPGPLAAEDEYRLRELLWKVGVIRDEEKSDGRG